MYVRINFDATGYDASNMYLNGATGSWVEDFRGKIFQVVETEYPNPRWKVYGSGRFITSLQAHVVTGTVVRINRDATGRGEVGSWVEKHRGEFFEVKKPHEVSGSSTWYPDTVYVAIAIKSGQSGLFKEQFTVVQGEDMPIVDVNYPKPTVQFNEITLESGMVVEFDSKSQGKATVLLVAVGDKLDGVKLGGGADWGQYGYQQTLLTGRDIAKVYSSRHKSYVGAHLLNGEAIIIGDLLWSKELGGTAVDFAHGRVSISKSGVRYRQNDFKVEYFKSHEFVNKIIKWGKSVTSDDSDETIKLDNGQLRVGCKTFSIEDIRAFTKVYEEYMKNNS